MIGAENQCHVERSERSPGKSNAMGERETIADASPEALKRTAHE
jgi:hypothetical protein